MVAPEPSRPAEGGESRALRRALAEAELLNAIAVAAASEDELPGILSAALTFLRHLIAFTGGSVALVEQHELVIRAAVGPFAESALGQRLPRGRGRSWRVIQEGKPFLSHDLAAEGARATSPVRSYLAVPLLWRRETFGLLEVDSVEPNAFTDDDVRLLQRTAVAIAGPIQVRRRHVAEQRARTEAEAAVRARDVFLGIAAHELKTPVTSMRGYAQFILRRLQRDQAIEPQRLRHAMETIDRQAEKLGRLMTQLLDVSRLDAGRFTLDRQPTELRELVTRAVDDLRFRAADRDVRVSLPETALVLSIDPPRIEQVLANLLDNALRFGPSDQPIDITLTTADGGARIEVRDRGPGVPESLRPQLFGRFSQAQSAGYQEGMGIGLYLSKEIVERHGGRVEASFPPEGGSSFSIVLPLP